jgi:hypothetical protein
VNALANDPTRHGTPVPSLPDGRARISLAEVEAVCAKAARGAGLSWGLAEEAGAAARWLAAQGLPGPELLARHLEACEHKPWAQAAPLIDGRAWRARGGGRLCPLAAGTALCDRAGLADGPGGEPLVMRNVASPALVLSFASFAAARLGASLAVEWDGVQALVTGGGLAALTGLEDLEAPQTGALRLTMLPAAQTTRQPCDGRVVELSLWRRLDRLALLTTVPPSERSRADAGAATTDND